MNRAGSSSVVLLAVLCALSSSTSQDSSPSSVVELSLVQEEMPNFTEVASGPSEGTYKRSALLTNFPEVASGPSEGTYKRSALLTNFPEVASGPSEGTYKRSALLTNFPEVASGPSEGTYKRSALLTNFPSFRQSTAPEFPDRRDQYRSGYRHEEEPPLAYIPLVQSFQAASYVHDDVPFKLFFNERRESGAAPLPSYLISQTATQTERSSAIVPVYFDEHDEHLKLTDFEERVKIYYNGRPELVPPFQNWKKLDEAKKKQNRFFKYFKTQRANNVVSN